MSTRKLTGKNLTMPFAAITMATLLFIYSRSSIHAAKANAALHREADGGQISWQKQSLRQHGLLETPTKKNSDPQGSALDRVAGSVPQEKGGIAPVGMVGRDVTEEKIRERVAEGRGR
ncbi:hypothetical protein L211DRAFT_397244 [Terfezia boudieri ATCC MYA-4762]|uniref:Uncharacterized protein n=1 Tax=Terfezia boudieri ATCC MYA-4762 TaxID=1051890 RepID=A0A3N4M3Q1_9PEZI|nr:hypothetical protein L211DRAFT_397244 [Terfezia boudieri ATCC MYA-4762]